jgi:hypothetical protein
MRIITKNQHNGKHRVWVQKLSLADDAPKLNRFAELDSDDPRLVQLRELGEKLVDKEWDGE